MGVLRDMMTVSLADLFNRETEELVIAGTNDHRTIDTSAVAKREVASSPRCATPTANPPLVDEEGPRAAQPSPDGAQGRVPVRRRVVFDAPSAGPGRSAPSSGSDVPVTPLASSSSFISDRHGGDDCDDDHRDASSAADTPASTLSTPPPAALSPPARSKEPARSAAPPHGHPRLSSGASTPPDIHYKQLTFGAAATSRSSPTPCVTRRVSFADEAGAPLTHTTWIPRRPSKEEVAQEVAREARAAALEAITPSVILSKMLDAMHGSSSSSFPPTLRAFR